MSHQPYQLLTAVSCATKLTVVILNTYTRFANSQSANADVCNGLVSSNSFISFIEYKFFGHCCTLESFIYFFKAHANCNLRNVNDATGVAEFLYVLSVPGKVQTLSSYSHI